MRIKREDKGAVTVLHLSGNVTGGTDPTRFESAVDALISQGGKLARLDVGNVNFISSPAVSFISRAYARYIRHGGEMVATSITGKVALTYELFFRRLFQTLDSRAEAVAALTERELAEHN